MTLFEIQTTYGTPAVLRLLGLIAAFLAVHVLRCPLAALVWLLTALMRAIDRTVAARVAAGTPPPRHPGRARPSWMGAP